jgi:glucose/arabinose dehydrogenase
MPRPSLVAALGAAAASLALLAAAGAGAAPRQAAPAVALAPHTVIAHGLINPRGLAFGPDGALYVAEAGSGGTLATTAADCQQVPVPIGPDSAGFTSRILRVGAHGRLAIAAAGLPSTRSSTPGGDTLGIADVRFLHGRLYALSSGAGCSHGLIGTSNALLLVRNDGSTSQVADLSAFLHANPPADDEFELNDWEPDGTWYSMVAAGDGFDAAEPNHQEIDHIALDGSVTRLLDMSRVSQRQRRWIGPTSLSRHGGALYFGALGPFPLAPGTDAIWRLGRGGRLTRVATGLSAVLATAWDASGHLYALESMTQPGFPTPAQLGSGRVVRVAADGRLTTVVDGLSFPSAMTFGPDGALYISNLGFGATPGSGEIWRVDLTGAA